MLKELDETLAKQSTKQNVDPNVSIIHSRLFSLQVKEKHVKAAQEWPIDLSFLSKLLAMVLIPIASRVVFILILS